MCYSSLVVITVQTRADVCRCLHCNSSCIRQIRVIDLARKISPYHVDSASKETRSEHISQRRTAQSLPLFFTEITSPLELSQGSFCKDLFFVVAAQSRTARKNTHPRCCPKKERKTPSTAASCPSSALPRTTWRRCASLRRLFQGKVFGQDVDSVDVFRVQRTVVCP